MEMSGPPGAVGAIITSGSFFRRFFGTVAAGFCRSFSSSRRSTLAWFSMPETYPRLSLAQRRSLAEIRIRSMTACHRKTFSSEILSQIHFHPRRRFKRHRIQMRIKLRQQPNPITLHHIRRLHTRFMILKPLLRRKPRHPDINARLLRIPLRILRTHLPQAPNRRIQQHNINIVMILRARDGAQSSKSPPLQSRKAV
jgi:hypothetical protein